MKNVAIVEQLEYFNIGQILESGQVFRFEKINDHTYILIAKGKCIKITQLPESNREAFCMRDIFHQCNGGQVLGLRAHNKNMLKKFAENISETRDYCTYWEINRYDKPAPVDYKDDEDFWYNLPANFDMIDCCFMSDPDVAEGMGPE